MRNLICVFFISFLFSSCSNKQLYQVGQDYQKSKCTKHAKTAQQFTDCLNNEKKTYDEYQKELKDVKNK